MGEPRCIIVLYFTLAQDGNIKEDSVNKADGRRSLLAHFDKQDDEQ